MVVKFDSTLQLWLFECSLQNFEWFFINASYEKCFDDKHEHVLQNLAKIILVFSTYENSTKSVTCAQNLGSDP